MDDKYHEGSDFMEEGNLEEGAFEPEVSICGTPIGKASASAPSKEPKRSHFALPRKKRCAISYLVAECRRKLPQENQERDKKEWRRRRRRRRTRLYKNKKNVNTMCPNGTSLT